MSRINQCCEALAVELFENTTGRLVRSEFSLTDNFSICSWTISSVLCLLLEILGLTKTIFSTFAITCSKLKSISAIRQFIFISCHGETIHIFTSLDMVNIQCREMARWRSCLDFEGLPQANERASVQSAHQQQHIKQIPKASASPCPIPSHTSLQSSPIAIREVFVLRPIFPQDERSDQSER